MRRRRGTVKDLVFAQIHTRTLLRRQREHDFDATGRDAAPDCESGRSVCWRTSSDVEVSWDGGSIQGEGHSIKTAEAAAARAALEGMKLDETLAVDDTDNEGSD